MKVKRQTQKVVCVPQLNKVQTPPMKTFPEEKNLYCHENFDDIMNALFDQKRRFANSYRFVINSPACFSDVQLDKRLHEIVEPEVTPRPQSFTEIYDRFTFALCCEKGPSLRMHHVLHLIW